MTEKEVKAIKWMKNIKERGVSNHVKKSMQRDRNRPVTEMLLMMFRSCARDSFK